MRFDADTGLTVGDENSDEGIQVDYDELRAIDGEGSVYFSVSKERMFYGSSLGHQVATSQDVKDAADKASSDLSTATEQANQYADQAAKAAAQAVSDSLADYKAANDEVTATNAKRLSGIGDYVDDYLNKYMTFETEGLVVGRRDDSGNIPNSVAITDTAVEFRRDGKAVAYTQQNEFYFDHGRVGSDLAVGDWAWVNRSNGNLALVWQGE